MKFANSAVEQIQNILSPSEIIKQKVALKSKGHAEFLGVCPFHHEKTPSFTVSDNKGFYHCFGCGEHGNIFDFVMKTENISFKEALEKLALKAGVNLVKLTPAEIEVQKKITDLYQVLELASKWFAMQLEQRIGFIAREYLQKRGVSADSIKKFTIGYAPQSGLYNYMIAKNTSADMLINAGLIAKNEDGGFYERFRNRLILPIGDHKGRIVGFGGRALDDAMPKYLNSPETSLFKKGELLYNFYNARAACISVKNLIVVEGYMDVIALDSAGYQNVVAPLGTAVTEKQLQSMWYIVDEPIMCLDGDKAGLNATSRVADLALPLLKPGKTLQFVQLPQGFDPDDIIKKKSKSAFADLLNLKQSLSDFLWHRELNIEDISTPERKAKFEMRINNLSAKIKDGKVLTYYNKYFKNKLYALNSNYNKTKLKERKTNLRNINDFAEVEDNSCEIRLYSLIINNPVLLCDEVIYEEFVNLEFLSNKLDNMRTAILETFTQDGINFKEKLLSRLVKDGYDAYIPILDNFVSLQCQERLIQNWRYFYALYNLTKLQEESHSFSSQLTEEAEEKSAQLRLQIIELSYKIQKMEMDFGDNG